MTNFSRPTNQSSRQIGKRSRHLINKDKICRYMYLDVVVESVVSDLDAEYQRPDLDIA